MKIPVALAITLFLCGTAIPDQDGSYTQSYIILIRGEVAGNEVVTEGRGASGELVAGSTHEIFVSDGMETKRMAFTTRSVFSQSALIQEFYSCRYTSGESGDSYEVTIRDGQATRTLNRGGQTSETTVPWQPNMVLLDFNVYHHYDYLIRRYDIKKGERQLFADFVPVIGSDIPLAVTLLGSETLNIADGDLAVNNFRVEFVGMRTGTLSVDGDGRLVRLSIPSQDLMVVRHDLLRQ